VKAVRVGFISSSPMLGRLGNALLGLLAGALVLAGLSNTASAADTKGLWLTQDKDAVLTIDNCGDQICGRIIWLKDAVDGNGLPNLDKNNPDPAKRTQPICGLVILSELKPSSPDIWEGYIYNPEDGRTYSVNVTALSDNALKIRGYIGLSIFGGSQIWTRVNDHSGDYTDDNCRPQG